MSYIDRHLVPDEQVVFRTRLHPIVLGSTITFAACVVGATVLIIVRNELAPETVRLLWLAAAGVILVSLAPPVLRWRTSEFAVTNRRVLVKIGLLSVHTVELLLPKVEAMSVDQSFAGRVLGYGTLRLSGSGGTVEVFPRVARPEGLREALVEQAPRSPAVRAR
jgi:uncharacterized membrane protein YdbT with pleckstrin-like domain